MYTSLTGREKDILSVLLDEEQFNLFEEISKILNPYDAYMEMIAQFEDLTGRLDAVNPTDYVEALKPEDRKVLHQKIGEYLGLALMEIQNSDLSLSLMSTVSYILKCFLVEKQLTEDDKLLLVSFFNDEQESVFHKIAKNADINEVDLFIEVLNQIEGIEGFDEERTEDEQEEIFAERVRELFIEKILFLPEDEKIMLYILICDAFPFDKNNYLPDVDLAIEGTAQYPE